MVQSIQFAQEEYTSAFADAAGGLVEALAAAGAEGVGEELNNRLQQDLAFWRSTGPTLQQNWWNQDPSPNAPLRDRYSQTYELIVALEEAHSAGARETASSSVISGVLCRS
jgi:hypothetical protein